MFSYQLMDQDQDQGLFQEHPLLPYGGALWNNSSTEERVSHYIYNGAGNGNPEEAKLGKATVWNVDDLTPEDETMIDQEDHPFEQKEKTSEEEILVPAEHGTQAFYCDNDALQSRDAKETDCSQETSERCPLV
uniref:Uncharacterized protein n=1 Tax=Sphaerodactylus townsendi TaxID=933632 RepID=A0ACB8EY88_9SAUR